MKSLSDALLEYRFDITDNDAFHSISSDSFNKAVKTASNKYVAKYNSHANSTADFVFIYEYYSFLGFVQGFAITDSYIYGDDGVTFELPLNNLASVKYDDEDHEIVLSPKNGSKHYIKVSANKKQLAKTLASIINDYII